MEEEIKVSICCTVYNHEKYLRKCLDGFVMQKTNFAYEVLIHDDASTDHSADIIREYEQKYPNIIKPIYQTENQYSQGVKISWVYQYPRAKGKYIALCEGDDYWCDENKLQVQFDAMEAHPNVVFCAHKVQCIRESGEFKQEFYPRKTIESNMGIAPERMIEIMREHRYPFQTSSYFFRTESVNHLTLDTAPVFMLLGGDLMLLMYMITEGDFYYIDNVFSYYRNDSIGSWSERNKNRVASLCKNSIAAYYLFDLYTGEKYSKTIERIVKQLCFDMYEQYHDYKKMCKLENRWILNQLPFKQRLFYQISAVFPQFPKLYKKLKSTRARVSNNGKKD